MRGLLNFITSLPGCFRRCACGERARPARGIKLAWAQRNY